MATRLILDALLAAASLTLRFTSVLFVQWLPLGNRYLPRIYGSFALYVVAAVAKWVLSIRPAPRPSKRGRGRPAWLTLLLGGVDARRPRCTVVGLVWNLLSLAAVLDFVYRSHVLHARRDLVFSRVGYVNETSARIVVRSPPGAAAVVRLDLFAATTPLRSAVLALGPDTDGVGTFVLDGLAANTSYTYTTNASHAGTFRTLAAVDGGRPWSMVSTSCIMPFFPYWPTDHGLRLRGLEHLDAYLSALNVPVDFMLFLGDFIYIDLPVALGWDGDAYATAYRQIYASPSWTARLRSLPWLHVYDDHEIRNDYTAGDPALYDVAMAPFWAYHGGANPPSQFGPDQSYYVVRRGGVAFFVLDTRRYRVDGTMLGAGQLADLLAWLDTETAWRVVVSSVPFTRNWRGPDANDSWAGYLEERERILERMKQTGGGILLSGDRHEHATTLFPASGRDTKPVIEFSTSPLSQFYEPFDRLYREMEPSDVAIHSHPWGHSKFGVVTFDESTAGRLRTHYDLVVDGQKVWEYDWEQTRTRAG